MKYTKLSDIDKISVCKLNFRTNKTSPARFTGGGARGGSLLEAREILLSKDEGVKPTARVGFIPSEQPARRSLFEAHTQCSALKPAKETF